MSPSSSLLLSLLRFLLPCLEDLPHVALAGNPLLHLSIKLAKLLLLCICFLEKCFLAFLQRLSLVFQLLSRRMLILNPRNSQIMFIAISMLRVCSKELLWCCER
jgi:hypothetical protein